MDNDTVKILLDMRADVAETKALIETLSGPDGRIKQLETAQVQQWWVTVAIAPVLTIAHGIARKMGVQI